MLLLGKRSVLKALLWLRDVFGRTGSHYLLNRLYLDDYCVWVQGLQKGVCEAIGAEYNAAKSALVKDRLSLSVKLSHLESGEYLDPNLNSELNSLHVACDDYSAS